MKRLIRILVYDGTDDFIQNALAGRSIKGSYTVRGFNGSGTALDGIIKEAIVGDFLEEVVTSTVTEVPTVV